MKWNYIIGGVCLIILGIVLIRSSRTKPVASGGQVTISSNGAMTVQPLNDRATFTVVGAVPQTGSGTNVGTANAGAK